MVLFSPNKKTLYYGSCLHMSINSNLFFPDIKYFSTFLLSTMKLQSFSFSVICWTSLNQIMQRDFFPLHFVYWEKCLTSWARQEVIIVYNMSRLVKLYFRIILRKGVHVGTEGRTLCRCHWGRGSTGAAWRGMLFHTSMTINRYDISQILRWDWKSPLIDKLFKKKTTWSFIL